MRGSACPTKAGKKSLFFVRLLHCVRNDVRMKNVFYEKNYFITPNSLPTLVNAAMALSKCSLSCPADI